MHIENDSYKKENPFVLLVNGLPEQEKKEIVDALKKQEAGYIKDGYQNEIIYNLIMVPNFIIGLKTVSMNERKPALVEIVDKCREVRKKVENEPLLDKEDKESFYKTIDTQIERIKASYK